MIRRVHHVTHANPFELCKIADVSDTPVNPVNVAKYLDLITELYGPIAEAGVTPLSVGGDHLITLPTFREIGKDGPVGMIHFDAQTDTADEAYNGEEKSPRHALLPRRQRRTARPETGHPNRHSRIELGRRLPPVVPRQRHAGGLYRGVFRDWRRRGIAGARRIVGDGPTYVSFDVDGLNPVYALGTGTPEVGGYTTHDAQSMLRGLSSCNLIGGHVVEVSPPLGPSGNTALVGATMMFEILCLLAEARVTRA